MAERDFEPSTLLQGSAQSDRRYAVAKRSLTKVSARKNNGIHTIDGAV